MHDCAEAASSLVLFDLVEPAIARVTLNRPEARNALSRALITEFRALIERIGRDDGIAAVILAANGRVFSSGHDLKELTSHRGDEDGGLAFFRETMQACAALMQAIVACPKPVIAAVEGRATAAGCQLVATCDLAVASVAADFATPGVNIGLFCSTPMVALSRNVSRKRAMEMLLLGEAIGAVEAAQYGLINCAVQEDRVLATAIEMARKIAAKSKAAVAIGKETFYRQVEEPLGQAYSRAAEVMVESMMMADAEEGICAFIEKRAANWKDR